MMPVTTAFIMAAGYGTRFFPITKAIQKEMLPIHDRPVIDYLVGDCLKAGIEHIIIAVREEDNTIERYYADRPELLRFLEKKGKPELVAEMERIAEIGKKITFLKIKDDGQYGTAIPVKAARSYLEKEEAFLVMTADDLHICADGGSILTGLIQIWEKWNTPVITCLEVAAERVSMYGIAETETRQGVAYLTALVEKPAVGTVSSRLANQSKYLLTPDIFPIIDGQKPNQSSGELYLTDTIVLLAKQRPVAVQVPQAIYLDCGNPTGLMEANLFFAKGIVPQAAKKAHTEPVVPLS
jgi:UTP--glucose-1-phosphate uridylyltransferase